MIDLNAILHSLQNSPGARKTALVGGGAAMAGLAAGMLTGKAGRKMVGKAAKYGAVAALGGLAYHAISRHKSRQSNAAPSGLVTPDYESAPAGTPYLPAADNSREMEMRQQSLLRAMIAAAKADGRISDREHQLISRQLADAGLDAESRAFVETELAKPLELDEVVSGIMGLEHAAEVYAASLVAIDSEGPIERAYLQMLAARLALDPALVEEIHRSAMANSARLDLPHIAG